MSGSALPRLFEPDPLLQTLNGARARWPWAIAGTVSVFVLYWPLFSIQNSLPAALNSDEVFLPGDLGCYTGIGLFGVFLVIAPVLVFAALHGRSWFEWRPTQDSRRLSDFSKAALALALLLGGFTIGDYLFRPERFTARPLADGYWLWFALGLLMLVPQTFGEEALFKGYLMRVWGAAFPYRWPVAFVLTALFTAIHNVNTDFAADRLGAVADFMTSGLVSFALYFHTRSLAAPTGIHFANNVFALLLFNREPGGMSKGTVFTYSDPLLAAGKSLLSTPDGIVLMFGTHILVAVLLLWPRSPLYLGPARS